MNKHTPGPWSGKTVIAMTVVLEECGVSLGFGSRRTEETVANARLIAAAPDLLEAAENALGVFIACTVPADGCDDRTAILDSQRQLRAAIAKATGAA